MGPGDDVGLLGEQHDLPVLGDPRQQVEDRLRAFGIAVDGDVVEEERAALIPGDEALGHGHPEQQVHLLGGAVREQARRVEGAVGEADPTWRVSGSTVTSW